MLRVKLSNDMYIFNKKIVDMITFTIEKSAPYLL